MADVSSLEGLLKTIINNQKALDNKFTQIGVLIKSVETEQKFVRESLDKLDSRVSNVERDLRVLNSRVGVNDEDLSSINSKLNRISKALVEVGKQVRTVHDGWIEESSDRRLVQKELADELKGMQAQIDSMEREKVAAGES